MARRTIDLSLRIRGDSQNAQADLGRLGSRLDNLTRAAD